ncbi:MAG: MaoC family dehydratase [Dehalococcoidia bacterium]|tara:strand:- start:957 stop:1364 length:408 start_codon:yes stop_codon:yes gene_type:complete
MPEKNELIAIQKIISFDLIKKYAEASGDFNPIHINKEFGIKSQFKNNIAHGMMIASSISELMYKNFGESWSRNGNMKIKFKLPIFPNDTIITEGTIKKTEEVTEGKLINCTVTVKNHLGEIAISGETTVTIKYGE